MRDVNGATLRHRRQKRKELMGRSFEACWVSDGVVISCGHRHAGIVEAANCGPLGSFVRAIREGSWYAISTRERMRLRHQLDVPLSESPSAR